MAGDIGILFLRVKTFMARLYGGPWYRRVAVWAATIVLAIALLLMAVDCNFLYLFGKSPGLDDIKEHEISEASEIYSADGVLMGRYFNENRTPVSFQEISPIMIRTLIDTEDERFYSHHGIDFRGLFAAVRDMFRGRARGASTITQQLAKNMFRVRTKYSTGLLGRIPGVKILVMKAKEWIVAVKLESIFNKEEILTMYLNTVDFGSNSYGIKTAARTYFGTTPDKLSYEQAAVLVGLLKATSSYNPRLNPKNCMMRRNTVLDLVYGHGDIYVNGTPASPAQLDSLKNLPIEVKPRSSESRYDGPAPYFREALADYINMLCEKGLIPGYNAINKLDLYADGLKIYTTIDMRMQEYAEQAARKQMQTIQQRFNDHWGNTPPWRDRQYNEIPDFIEDIAKKTDTYKYLTKKFPDQPDSVQHYLNTPHNVKVFSYEGPKEMQLSTMDSIRYMVRFMHCGFIAIEPDTRHVKAWVGDVDFDSWKYDKVTAMRQPGSTFKLFVYSEAMNQGFNPCDRRMDSWVGYPDTVNGKATIWAPHNANGYFSNLNMPLRSAFAQSINSIAVKLGVEVGIHNVANTAHRMGIESPLHETKSLCLGSSDVSLYELVNSYCTVVNDGKYNMPIMVTRIEDRNGNLVYSSSLHESQAISYRSAYLMLMMLKAGLTERGGTSAALWSYINPVLRYSEFGGKTGTSNNHSDAWFVGVTPRLVAGAWVGGEYRCIHFRTGQLGQGSRTALPIFGYFIQDVLKDDSLSKYRAKFRPPKGLDPSLWNCEGVYAQNPDTLQTESAERPDSIGKASLPPQEGALQEDVPTTLNTEKKESDGADS